MEILNEWFTKIDDLKDIDDKIAQLQAGSGVKQQKKAEVSTSTFDEINDIVSRISDLESAEELQELKEKHQEVLNLYKLNETVEKKISLLRYKLFLSKYEQLGQQVAELSVDETDKYNKAFYYEAEVLNMSKLLLQIVNFGKTEWGSVYYGVYTEQHHDCIKRLFEDYNAKVMALKSLFIAGLKELVEESAWIDLDNITNINDIANCCTNFNSLQNCYIVATHFLAKNGLYGSLDATIRSTMHLESDPCIEVWSVEILLQPIITKFIFHFYGKNLTNKLNQPELATEYFLNFLQDDVFLSKAGKLFSPTLRMRSSECNEYLENAIKYLDSQVNLVGLHYNSVIIEIVKVFNKFLRIKFLNDIKTNKSSYFNENSRLFTNLMYQLNKYDSAVFDLFFYTDHNLILEILLSNDNWSSWIALEKSHLVRNFNSKFPSVVIDHREPNSYNEETFMSEDIFSIDFNIVKNNNLKPTKIAVNFLNLLKNLIDFIVSLKIPVALKLKLVTELIFHLLDLYHDKFSFLLKNSRIASTSYLNSLIADSLVAFTSKETGRTQHSDGILSEIKTLCKIYCSIKYIVIKLESYNQNVEFLKMAEYVKSHPSLQELNYIGDHDSLFKRHIIRFNTIIEETLHTLDNFLKKSLKIYLKAYLNLNNYWTEQGDIADEPTQDKCKAVSSFADYINYGFEDNRDNLQLTNELKNPINILINQLKFLRNCFGNGYLNTLSDYKSVETLLLNHLYYYFYSYIIKINKFSAKGAAQLKFDYLMVLEKILHLDNDDKITQVNPMIYDSVSQQQFLVRVVDSCNVLITNKKNFPLFNPYNGDLVSDFQRFKNLQDFTRLKDGLNITSLTDDEIYDLLSRVWF